jgi:RNA-binding protein NOB1
VLTVKEVAEEIRDARTRRRLQVLPYELVFREPSQEALHRGEADA